MQMALNGYRVLSDPERQLVETACRSLFGERFTSQSPFPLEHPWIDTRAILFGPAQDFERPAAVGNLKEDLIKYAQDMSA